MIPETALILAEDFPWLSSEQVAAALTRGLEPRPVQVLTQWNTVECDASLRAARALVIAAAHLNDRTLAGSPAFEAATQARQAGVPTYAVTGENALDPFEARIVDLQVVLEAGTPRSLSAAGRRLAQLL